MYVFHWLLTLTTYKAQIRQWLDCWWFGSGCKCGTRFIRDLALWFQVFWRAYIVLCFWLSPSDCRRSIQFNTSSFLRKLVLPGHIVPTFRLVNAVLDRTLFSLGSFLNTKEIKSFKFQRIQISFHAWGRRRIFRLHIEQVACITSLRSCAFTSRFFDPCRFRKLVNVETRAYEFGSIWKSDKVKKFLWEK